MKSFDALNWYWIVGADTARVYTTGTINDYVPIADPAYVAWLGDGTLPTKIDTEFNLGGTLATYYPRLRPLPPGVLDGYIDAIAVNAVTDETFAILWNHENRIRNQEGLPPLQLGQAKQSFARRIRRFPPPAADVLADNGGFAHDGEED
jgi:hypothetical protein